MTEKLLKRRKRNFSKNPFIETIFTADPSAHVWEDGRLYVYPSHDIDPAQGCDFMDRYHVFSTKDMINWRDEGEILKSDNVSWGRDEGGFMWAPDCAFHNGKYYFYFPHPSETDWNNSWKIGVAVSNYPAKDFKEIGFVENIGGPSMIDPCVFVDDDNTPYMFYGGGGRCEAGRLKDDMLSIDGEMIEMQGLVDFHEAAWVFKREGLYYLTYSDNQRGNNNMRYATSESPLGPWKHRGIYLASTDCETSHGSVVKYQGNWYAFYHSDDLSAAGTLRSICCDPIVFNEDGSMELVIQSRNGRRSTTNKDIDNEEISVIYSTLEASAQSTVTFMKHELAHEGQSATGFFQAGKVSKLIFEEVEGFENGKVNLGIYYATADKLAKLALYINGKFETLLNNVFTGSLETFEGYANYTLTLQPGKTNTIELCGYEGELSVEAISVTDFSGD